MPLQLVPIRDYLPVDDPPLPDALRLGVRPAYPRAKPTKRPPGRWRAR